MSATREAKRTVDNECVKLSSSELPCTHSDTTNLGTFELAHCRDKSATDADPHDSCEVTSLQRDGGVVVLRRGTMARHRHQS